jgi:hypothetical protein
VATALIGSVTGCGNPFARRNQTTNQVRNPSETAQNQQGTRTQRANQPTTTQAQNPNAAGTQSPDATIDPETPNTGGGSGGSGQGGVSALW